MRWINCIENFFIIQYFWTTCTCPEKQSFPWNFALYWLYTFYHSGFLSNLRLPWKTDLTWNSSLYWNIFIIQDFWATCACPEKQSVPWIHLLNAYFSSLRIFEQLALALKNRVALKIFRCFEIFFVIQDFEQLALVLKTKFAPKFFTGMKYYLSFRNFEQLALAL